MIKLLLVDNHVLVCTVLAHILKRSPKIEIVGTSYTGADTLKQCELLKPDIILLDIRLPDYHARDLLPKIRSLLPHTHVIILAACTQDSLTNNLIQLGAKGILLKSASHQEIIAAIQEVYAGKTHIMPKIAHHLALLLTDPKPSPLESLSKRERHIIQLMLNGKSARAIAQLLKISIKTVSTFKRRAFKKLDIQRDSDLVLLVHNYSDTAF